MTVTRAELVEMRVTKEMSAAEIGDVIGIRARQVRGLLERHGIKLSPDAAARLTLKGTAAGRAVSAARRKHRPNEAQRAWGTGRFGAPIDGAREPVVPTGPRPRIVGTDMREMIDRAIASGYPVTVAPPAFADGSRRLSIGQGVG